MRAGLLRGALHWSPETLLLVSGLRACGFPTYRRRADRCSIGRRPDGGGGSVAFLAWHHRTTKIDGEN